MISFTLAAARPSPGPKYLLAVGQGVGELGEAARGARDCQDDADSYDNQPTLNP